MDGNFLGVYEMVEYFGIGEIFTGVLREFGECAGLGAIWLSKYVNPGKSTDGHLERQAHRLSRRLCLLLGSFPYPLSNNKKTVLSWKTRKRCHSLSNCD